MGEYVFFCMVWSGGGGPAVGPETWPEWVVLGLQKISDPPPLPCEWRLPMGPPPGRTAWWPSTRRATPRAPPSRPNTCTRPRRARSASPPWGRAPLGTMVSDGGKKSSEPPRPSKPVVEFLGWKSPTKPTRPCLSQIMGAFPRTSEYKKKTRTGMETRNP